MRDGILSEVDAATILNLLDLEWHEHGKALCGQGAEGVDLPHPNGENGVQPVQLLIFQRCHLAHMLPRNGEDGIRVGIQLLLAVGGEYHGQHGEHHPLVTGGEIV